MLQAYIEMPQTVISHFYACSEIVNKVRYLLSEARKQPLTCRWVCSRCIKLFSQKIPYAGFSIDGHMLKHSPLSLAYVLNRLLCKHCILLFPHGAPFTLFMCTSVAVSIIINLPSAYHPSSPKQVPLRLRWYKYEWVREIQPFINSTRFKQLALLF